VVPPAFTLNDESLISAITVLPAFLRFMRIPAKATHPVGWSRRKGPWGFTDLHLTPALWKSVLTVFLE